MIVGATVHRQWQNFSIKWYALIVKILFELSWYTFEEGTELSYGADGSSTSKLTNGHLHVGQRYPTNHQHDEERDQERSCNTDKKTK